MKFRKATIRMKNRIKRIVSRLVKKYETRDPFKIAAAMKFLFIYKDLPDNLLGYYIKCIHGKLIVLNIKHESFHRITVAHELGHYFLHPKCNRTFLTANSLYNKGRFERLADMFAAELLISNEAFKEFNTIEEIAASLAVTCYIVELKAYFKS